MVGWKRDPCSLSQNADLVAAADEELSDEDQQLKNELDMMVERLTVSLVKMAP